MQYSLHQSTDAVTAFYFYFIFLLQCSNYSISTFASINFENETLKEMKTKRGGESQQISKF